MSQPYRPHDLSAFALALGQVVGAVDREDIMAWLLHEGVTVEQIEEFKVTAIEIAKAFYFRGREE